MTTLSPQTAASPGTAALGMTDRLARRILFSRLETLSEGTLVVHEADGRTSFGNGHGPEGHIHVRRPRFYRAVLLGGSVGAAESYMHGHWESPDLVSVVRVMSRNMQVTAGLEGGAAMLAGLVGRVVHALRPNTRDGARRNISAHYDLSNAFFAQFLDPTMMYSCAVFPTQDTDLQTASETKLDRICRKLALNADDHLLEIGTGWGAMAIWAAKHYGCRVTTTTISEAQHAWAAARIKEAGLEDRITLLQQDYRDLRGSFSKLVSVEMIEAVGHRFLPDYLQKCSDLLAPDGLMLLQAITMPDQRYHAALREVDFIKRYIFPGSFIPSVAAVLDASRRAGDLNLRHFEDQTPHYARTLAHWAARFHGARHTGDIGARPEWFKRMWAFYFAYCQGGFHERVIGCAQMLLAKPRCPHVPLLGEPTRLEENAC